LFIDLFVDKNREWAFWEGGGRESYSQPNSGKGSPSIRRYPFLHDVWLASAHTRGRMYDGRFVASAVLPMFFKTLCDDVDFAGGWLHERGPAGVEVSRDRRRRQKLETN